MEKLVYILLIVVSLVACKTEPKMQQELNSINPEDCPEDSTLLIQIATKNLLYEKTYVINDKKYEFLGIDSNTTAEQQNEMILELIERDSIPNSSFKSCNHRNNQSWQLVESIRILESETLDKIFENPYIISGTVDNYRILKETTGKTGFINVSEIYYSPNFEYALVGLDIHCGWKCGEGQIRLYRMNDNIYELKMKYIIREY